MNIKTVLSYLGYRGNHQDDAIISTIKQIESQLSETCGEPKYTMGIWQCEVLSNTVSFNHYRVESQSLAKHLTGARYIGLFAVTLGVQADLLIKRYTIQDMHRSVVADAVASVMVDTYCDTIEKQLAADPAVSGLRHTKRFSPGFGDFELTYQKDILQMLNAYKRTGISLTDGCMLVPSKSITAVIGFI
jgi:hypothetical protein